MNNETINILLAEDDPNLGTILRAYFKQKGCNVFLAIDGEKALEFFRNEENIDICVLDVMMPIKDGFEVAKYIRRINPSIPVIFLTAKTLENDKLKGFEIGADDYITKPFSIEELYARINAVLRRCHEERPSTSVFNIGRFTFNADRQSLSINGKEQHLTSKESDLMHLFCLNYNQVIDRVTTLNKIWKDDSYFAARSMDVYITKLRRYLKEDPSVKIVNIHGVGFKLTTDEANR